MRYILICLLAVVVLHSNTAAGNESKNNQFELAYKLYECAIYASGSGKNEISKLASGFAREAHKIILAANLTYNNIGPEGVSLKSGLGPLGSFMLEIDNPHFFSGALFATVGANVNETMDKEISFADYSSDGVDVDDIKTLRQAKIIEAFSEKNCKFLRVE